MYCVRARTIDHRSAAKRLTILRPSSRQTITEGTTCSCNVHWHYSKLHQQRGVLTEGSRGVDCCVVMLPVIRNPYENHQCKLISKKTHRCNLVISGIYYRTSGRKVATLTSLLCCKIETLKCVASLQKGPHVAKIKNEIFVDLNRAGHDKSVKKN